MGQGPCQRVVLTAGGAYIEFQVCAARSPAVESGKSQDGAHTWKTVYAPPAVSSNKQVHGGSRKASRVFKLNGIFTSAFRRRRNYIPVLSVITQAFLGGGSYNAELLFLCDHFAPAETPKS
jgi:hypothetical protein